MSRALLALALGVTKGLAQRRQADRAKRDRDEERQRGEEAQLRQMQMQHPEAFAGLEPAVPPPAPTISAARPTGEIDQGPMPLVGEKAARPTTPMEIAKTIIAPTKSTADLPDIVQRVSARAGVPGNGLPTNPLQAANRIVQFEGARKQERETANRGAFQALGSPGGTYNRAHDYATDAVKKDEATARQKEISGAIDAALVAAGVTDPAQRQRLVLENVGVAGKGLKLEEKPKPRDPVADYGARRKFAIANPMPSKARAGSSANPDTQARIAIHQAVGAVGSQLKETEAKIRQADKDVAGLPVPISPTDSAQARNSFGPWAQSGPLQIAKQTLQQRADSLSGVRDKLAGKLTATLTGAAPNTPPTKKPQPAAAKSVITRAEYKALMAAGHSDTEIKARYTVGQ